MAKRHKTTKKRAKDKVKEKAPESGGFWPQVGAVILIIVAFFLLLGGFEWGGILPIKLFDWTSWCLGLVAYLLPFVLLFWAGVIFKNEEHKLSVGKITSSLFFLFCLSGMLHVFVDRDESASVAAQGTYGGEVGHLFSSAFLSFLSSITAFVIFLILAWLFFMIMFSIAPKNMLKNLFKLFGSKEKNPDTSISELKAKESDFQVREGVPVVHHEQFEGRAVPGLGDLHQGDKTGEEESHAALTAASDPDWQFPSIELLNDQQDKADPGDTKARAEIIKATLADFGVEVKMEGANVGPRVTQYTLLPSPGQKLSKITAYEPNISYELATTSIRIEAPIPGKRAVGIEVPNIQPATVRISSILTSKEWTTNTKPLLFTVGKDIAGQSVVASLDKMPHLLVAGQTGSGKSVMINSILTSFLYRNSPSDLKLILIDPKQVEMAPYNNLPHLLTPVITETEKCISALKWSVAEMERRLRTFSSEGKRDIGEYNSDKKEERMPYIVIVIDEMADFMMAAGRDLEALIARIAQKARASGIHLILATQRPSVNVVTGLIKANVPARVAFTVVSQVDSRVIVDQSGAEKLLGNGDMLFVTADMPKPVRLQGALVEKAEIDKVCDFVRKQSEPQYNDEVISMPVQLSGRGSIVAEHMGDVEDEMWRDAVRVVLESGKASTSLLQRRLRIGYGRASRIIDVMEERGIVGPADGARPREVLVTSENEVFNSPSVSDAEAKMPTNNKPTNDVTHISVEEESDK